MFFPVSAIAQELTGEEANEICHAYIDHPEDFKEIKTEKCREEILENIKDKDNYFKSKYHRSGEYLDRLQSCFDFTDKRSGQKKVYGLFRTGGTCNSIQIVQIDILSDNLNFGDGEGIEEIPVNYNGQLVIKDYGALILGRNKRGDIHCSFSYHSIGWNAAQRQDNTVCKALSEGSYQTSREGISSEDENLYPDYPQSIPKGHFTADLNADGNKEEIIEYDFTSVAGCGCRASVLKIKENGHLVGGYRHHDKEVASNNSVINELDEKLESLTGKCGERYSDSAIITINGRDYVLLDRDITPKENNKAYYSRDLPKRELYAFENGEFVKVCTQEAKAKRVIEYEEVNQADGYIPL